jgi:hypothetical protein
MLKDIGLSKSHVPKFLFQSDEKFICAWLRGFFEADGCAKDRVSCSSSRMSLIEDIQQLLLSVGIVCDTRSYKFKNKEKTKEYLACCLDIKSHWTNIFYKKINFISKRKKGRLKKILKSSDTSSTYSRHPNLNKKASSYIINELKNTRNRGGFVSVKKAIELKDKYPDIYKELGLYKIDEWGQIYTKVKIIDNNEKINTYDIEVENTHSFIANGFISHNSQIELRVIAQLANDKNMLDGFNSGILDIHSSTACKMFEIDPKIFDKKNNPDHSNKRTSAKEINFGIIYLMSAMGLSVKLKNTVEESQHFINMWFDVFPGVKNFIDETRYFILKNHYVETLYGRRRQLPYAASSLSWMQEAAIRQGTNCRIQSPASDIFSMGMIKNQNMLDKNNMQTRIVGTVHDSIIFESPEDEIDFISVEGVKNMVTNIPRVTIKLEADVQILDKWEK